MTEFRKRYQSLPVDFHLWTQDKIAELWWKEALAWVQSRLEFGSKVAYSEAYILMAIKKEIREELEK